MSKTEKRHDTGSAPAAQIVEIVTTQPTFENAYMLIDRYVDEVAGKMPNPFSREALEHSK